MRFDISAFAAGLIGAFVAFVAVAVISDYRSIGSADWCAPGETVLVCVRQWSQIVAILGAFGTVFFIAHQVRSAARHHEENLQLQTLRMRALFARVMATKIDPIEKIVTRIEAALFRAGGTLTPEFLLHQMALIRNHAESAYKVLDEFDDGTIASVLGGLIDDVEEADAQLRENDAYGGFRPSKVLTENAKLSATIAVDAALRFTGAVRAQFPIDGGVPMVRGHKRSLAWLFTD